MREIQASEAKAHLASRLDDVERGETLVIPQHGKPIPPGAGGRRSPG